MNRVQISDRTLAILSEVPLSSLGHNHFHPDPSSIILPFDATQKPKHMAWKRLKIYI
jgi:hypothetical protein